MGSAFGATGEDLFRVLHSHACQRVAELFPYSGSRRAPVHEARPFWFHFLAAGRQHDGPWQCRAGSFLMALTLSESRYVQRAELYSEDTRTRLHGEASGTRCLLEQGEIDCIRHGLIASVVGMKMVG